MGPQQVRPARLEYGAFRGASVSSGCDGGHYAVQGGEEDQGDRGGAGGSGGGGGRCGGRSGEEKDEEEYGKGGPEE